MFKTRYVKIKQNSFYHLDPLNALTSSTGGELQYPLLRETKKKAAPFETAFILFTNVQLH